MTGMNYGPAGRTSRRRVPALIIRAFLWLGAGLLFLLLAGFLVIRTSLPVTEGTLELSGLSAPVSVVRDEHGIPHISAASAEDAYRALGFVHAQDRLWQMEFQRLVAAGRLSEAVGEAGLGTDRFLRTLGIYRAAESAWEHLADREARRWIIAYADGVNSFLNTRTGVLPPEFLLLGHRPEPFRPEDVLAWAKMMAWDLAGNWNSELLRARLLNRLPAREVDRLFPDWPGDMHVTLEGSWFPDDGTPEEGPPPAGPEGAEDEAAAARRLLAGLGDLLALLPPPLPEGSGSNAWVLSGEHTESGLPLLANDPHLGLQAPSLWYLVHVEAPGLSVTGASLPGTPAVLLGRNDRIAWGFTNTGSDVQDIFIEKLSPLNDGEYLTPDGPRAFMERQELIRVKGGADVVLTVRETVHGPVISDLVPDIGRPPGVGADPYVLAFSWTALGESDPTAAAVLHLNRATDWESFNRALENFHNPQQNIMYADVDGNIGFLAAGLVPIREGGDGTVPAPGWTGSHDWTGFIPFAELPRAFNPASGRIVNANQQVTPDDYPYPLTRTWAEPWRAHRIIELLDAAGTSNVARTVRIQGDQTSLFYRELAEELLRLEPADPFAGQLQADLLGWAGELSEASRAPLILARWHREFLELVYRERLGSDFASWAAFRPALTLSLLRGPDSACPEPGCRALAERAFRDAARWLKETLGEDPVAWRWGDLHRVVQEHAVLGGTPLGRFANLSIANGGDAFTVNAAGYPFLRADGLPVQDHGPGYRAVYDLADPEGGVFIHSTGQSGNLLSPHYRDLQALWRDNQPLRLRLSAPEEGRRLELRPAGR